MWIIALITQQTFFHQNQNKPKSYKNQECIPVGCISPARCPYLPACNALGASAPGGSAPGECLLWGVCSWEVCSQRGLLLGWKGDVYVVQQIPLWTELLTHISENILSCPNFVAGSNNAMVQTFSLDFYFDIFCGILSVN